MAAHYFILILSAVQVGLEDFRGRAVPHPCAGAARLELSEGILLQITVTEREQSRGVKVLLSA